MPLKRLAVGIAAAFLVSTLGLATSAQAIKRFSVVGGGAQSHIGNGLAIPIQQAAINSVTTMTMFPMTLRAPIDGVPIVTGTVAKPIMTAGTKMAYQRRLNIPAGVIRKNAQKKTVGVKFSNPSVFAVATTLNFSWPAARAVLSTGVAPPAALPPAGTSFGGSLTYSNPLGRFGGPAAFAISSGDPIGGDLYPVSPVTVFLKISTTITPPCTHPAYPGTGANENPNCLAGIILAYPGPLGGAGQSGIVSTPGGAVPGTVNNPNGLNIVIAKLGTSPLGTLLFPPALAAVAPLPTNMAMSQGGGWTTGRLTVANPAASPMTETWILSGMDSRTALGGGTIQLVAGAVSARPASGANANRSWVRLVLSPTFPVPSMSLPGIAALVALMVVAFGYTMRRKLFA
jgi:hypothetical protein